MEIRELAPLSVTVLRDTLKKHMKKADGSNYAVFDQLYNWIKSVDRLQEDTETLDIFTHDVKRDLDSWRSNKVNPTLSDHEVRLKAIEEAPNSPFPG